jgi:hypothetical protein
VRHLEGGICEVVLVEADWASQTLASRAQNSPICALRRITSRSTRDAERLI